jgi:hypothetical protein
MGETGAGEDVARQRIKMSAKGSKDDLIALKFDFRFTTGSGLKWDVAACLKGAMNRLMHRSKNQRNFDRSCGASNAAVDLAAQRAEVDRFG